MTTDLSLEESQNRWPASYKAYIIGFVTSLILTCISFFSVGMRLFSDRFLVLGVIALAVSQAFIQLHFFLHLGNETKPRWETAAFLFMVPVVLIIILGSLWIMYDLDMRMMIGDMSHD